MSISLFVKNDAGLFRIAGTPGRRFPLTEPFRRRTIGAGDTDMDAPPHLLFSLHECLLPFFLFFRLISGRDVFFCLPCPSPVHDQGPRRHAGIQPWVWLSTAHHDMDSFGAPETSAARGLLSLGVGKGERDEAQTDDGQPLCPGQASPGFQRVEGYGAKDKRGETGAVAASR